MGLLAGLGAVLVAWCSLTLLGLFVAVCWGLRPRIAALSAMPISFGLMAAATVVVPWRLLPILGAFLAVGSVGLLARSVRRPAAGPAWAQIRSWRTDLPTVELGALVLAMVLATVTVLWACRGSLDVVSQTWDALFHVNGIESGSVTGHLSPWGSGSFSGSREAVTAFYPSGFAAVAVFVMKVTGVGAVPASNIAAVLLAGGLWPSTMLLLARRVFGGGLLTTLATGVLSQAFWGFPWDPLGWGVLWPTAGALAFAPLVLTGVLVALRRPDELTSERRWHGLVLVGLSTVALLLFHPRELVVIFPEVALLAGVLLGRLAAWQAHPRWLRALLAVGALAALLLTPALWFGPWSSSKLAALPWRVTETTAQSVNGYLLNGPEHTAPGLLVAAAILVGTILSLRRSRTLWIPLVYVLAITVDVVTATSRNPEVLQVTRLWYGDRNRTAGVVPIAGVLLAVAGSRLAWKAVSGGYRRTRSDRSPDQVSVRPPTRGRPLLAAGAAVLTLLAVNLPAHAAYLEPSLAGGASDPTRSLVSPDQVALYRQLAARVRPDEYILNDPRDGSALLYAYSGRKPVYVTGTTATPAKHAAYLRAHLVFDRDHARVCAMLKADHIGWVLNVRLHSVKPPVGRRSATGMLIPQRFWLTTAVVSRGTTTLYKITGCR